MHRWYGDPTVRKFLSFGADSKKESEKHLKDTVIPSQSQNPRIEYYLAVELKETRQTIGDVGFEWKEPRLAEIGYFFEPSYWGCGYATEAAKLITQYAFDLGADSVIATCDKHNTASARVMRRCGLQPQSSDEAGRLLYRVECGQFVK
jgi:RimJ/RimL family protein N-acetyltransferase